jgi:iron(III) transport system substrate-binding protein
MLFRVITVVLMAWSGIAQAAELNVYSSRKQELVAPLLDKFSATSGIKVNLITAEDGMLIQRLKTEGKRSPADVLLLADAGRFELAAREGLLKPVSSPAITAAVPAFLRHPDGLWVGLTQRARVFAYASERVKVDELSDYLGLADPRWKGRLCARSSTNVYNQSLTAAMLAHHGAEKTAAWLSGMVANFARPPQGGDRDQIKDIAAGRCDIALVNTYYVGGMLNSQDPVEREAAARISLFFPDQSGVGTHMNISGAGVAVHSRNNAAALALIEFMLGEESQRWYADSNFEYPVRPGVKPGDLLVKWGDYRRDSLPLKTIGDFQQQATMAMDKAGWK